MSTPSAVEVRAVIRICRILADAIRDLGEVPSGHLYARVSDFLSLDNYNAAISFLKQAKLISESNNLLTWKGDLN